MATTLTENVALARPPGVADEDDQRFTSLAEEELAHLFASPPPQRERRLKVLFLSHYFPPEGNAPASRVHEMCKRWVRDGHDVTVVTCTPNCPTGIVYDGYRNRLYQSETIDGIRVVRVWTFIAANRGKIRRSLNFFSFLVTATLAAMLQRRPDVLIATSPQFFCGWAGTIVSTLRRLPFLLEIRDIWPASIAAVGAMKKRFLLRVLESLERLMYRSATHVVTVGDGYARELSQRGLDPDDVSVVTNGVDRDLFDSTTDGHDVRRRHRLDDDAFICSYVGTVGMACGLDVVLRAAVLLKQKGRRDVKFMLVGDGAVRGELQRQASEAGLDNVIFTGQLDKSLIPAHLAAADACLVHLRKQELFRTVLPSKMFEAAGMGKPIVIGVEGCAADFVERARAGIPIEPENEQQLVAALERLADDRALGRRMGDSGRAYVLRHFDRDKLARDYLRVIRNTCQPVELVRESVCA